MMKKVSLVITLLSLATTTILISCDSSVEINNELIGTWYTDGSIDEVVTMNATLEFNSDGTGMLTVNAEALATHLHRGDFHIEFEWSLGNGKIILDEITYGSFFNHEWSYSINGNILTIYDLAIGNTEDVFERIK